MRDFLIDSSSDHAPVRSEPCAVASVVEADMRVDGLDQIEVHPETFAAVRGSLRHREYDRVGAKIVGARNLRGTGWRRWIGRRKRREDQRYSWIKAHDLGPYWMELPSTIVIQTGPFDAATDMRP